MFNRLGDVPFWGIVTLQIISFMFIILPGILSLPPYIAIIFIFIEFLTIGLAISHILYQKKTKSFFYISWEILFFLYVFLSVIINPLDTFHTTEISQVAILVIALGLLAFETIFILYFVFKEKIIKHLLFSFASTTTVIVFFIVFFVMSEGLPAFQENDPVEFLTNAKFSPFHESDYSESLTFETMISSSDFTIETEKKSIYVPQGFIIDQSLIISNTGGSKDTFFVKIQSNINISLSNDTIEVEPHQSGVINYSIIGEQEGSYSIEIIVTSQTTGNVQTETITCSVSERGVSITPQSQSVTVHKDVSMIKIPLQFSNVGLIDDSYDVFIDAPDNFRPFILEIPWDYDNFTGTISLDARSFSPVTMLPQITTRYEDVFQINISIISQSDSTITDQASVFIDTRENMIVTAENKIKKIGMNNIAEYSVSFTDDVDDRNVEIKPKLLQGDAYVECRFANETISKGFNKCSLNFSKHPIQNLTFIVYPLSNNNSILTEITAFIPGTEPTLGILGFIVGTIMTTMIAVCIAAPLGVSIAIFLAEFTPRRIRTILRPLFELLAGIPSVIYGLYGFLIFGPLLKEHVYPLITGSIGQYIPFFYSERLGSGILTASIVLSIMILPIVITLSEDSIRSVRKSFKEGSLALGATRWQSIRRIILPQAKSGIIASIILGTGRAIGETMAVLMIMGGSSTLPNSIFDPITTMTGAIASYFESQFAFEQSRHALFAVGIILFLMVFILNVIIAQINKPKKQRNKDSADKSFMQGLFHLLLRKKKNTQKKDIPLDTDKQFDIEKNSYSSKTFQIIDDKLDQHDYSSHSISKLSSESKKIILGSTKKALRNEKIAIIGLIGAALLASFFLVHILSTIIGAGLTSMELMYFFEPEIGVGREGGFLNGIVGSIYLVGIALLFAGPLAIGAAIYVQEYAKTNNIITRIIMFTSDTLASTPSIIFGAFGFMLFVLYFEFEYSLLAGGLTLGIMIIPLLLRSSIEAIKAIPRNYQEGALALGASKWQSIRTVILPPASPGIVSGAIISMGRAIGETAAVLLTAGYAVHLPVSVLSPSASMPNLIYKNYHLSKSVPELADKVYSAAFTLIVVILIINAVARLFSYRASKIMKE